MGKDCIVACFCSLLIHVDTIATFPSGVLWYLLAMRLERAFLRVMSVSSPPSPVCSTSRARCVVRSGIGRRLPAPCLLNVTNRRRAITTHFTLNQINKTTSIAGARDTKSFYGNVIWQSSRETSFAINDARLVSVAHPEPLTISQEVVSIAKSGPSQGIVSVTNHRPFPEVTRKKKCRASPGFQASNPFPSNHPGRRTTGRRCWLNRDDARRKMPEHHQTSRLTRLHDRVSVIRLAQECKSQLMPALFHPQDEYSISLS